MSIKVPVYICPETNACWDMGDVHVISTAHALCGSHAFQHNFQLFVARRCALCRWFLVSLESHDRHSLLVALIIPPSLWSALNTPKTLRAPTAKNPEDEGQRIVQVSWLGLRVLFTVHRKSGPFAASQCGDNEVVPHHAWTTRVAVDEEAHVRRVLVNHSPKKIIKWNKNDVTMHLLVC
jgi:hypothetical protein